MKKGFIYVLISSLFLILLPSFTVVQKTNNSKSKFKNNNHAITWENLSKSDQQLLDKIERKSFEYFWDGADPKTGLGDAGSANKAGRVSIASEGFALSSICIADSRGWITHSQAYSRVMKILNSFYKDPNNSQDFCVQGKRGLFYHFINRKTGKRFGKSEVSTIDSGILMAGILNSMEHFKGTEIESLARKIYLKADWTWYTRQNGAIAAGWTPDRGIFGQFKGYNEYILAYVLGLGSPTHPMPDSSWNVYCNHYRWIKPYKNIGSFLTPLWKMRPEAYLYQFPACWIDFRGKKDHYADYWQNGINALTANRQYCLDWAEKNNYPDKMLWGWTACAGKDHYMGFDTPYNGTIAPSAVVASLPFIPNYAMPTIKRMYEKYGNEIWGKYGFTDAFNLVQNWYDKGYISIDEGNTVLMIENFRDGGVWKEFMNISYIKHAMEKAGFVSDPSIN